jgi:cytochrome c-type biogenesis protein CcsB
MSHVLKTPALISGNDPRPTSRGLLSYAPTAFALAAPFALMAWRVQHGEQGFISDPALMMLALACYLLAACFYLTNLWAPSGIAEKLGAWGTMLGVFFNLSSWLVRWVTTHDRELEVFVRQGRELTDMPWFVRYIPFANLYDMSLTFAFGAGITTLLVIRRPHFRVIATVALPLAAIILVLARFIGADIMSLPAVLDSYWRPIHVGVAAISYGTGLVCFAVAVLYLLKDNMRVETMAIWTAVFALGVFVSIGKFGIFAPGSFGTYTASTFLGNSKMSLALRADIPYAGWLIVASAAVLLGSLVAFAVYNSKGGTVAKRVGWGLTRAALAVQAVSIAVLVWQIKTVKDVVALIDPAQYERFAVWMLQQDQMPQQQINAVSSAQLNAMATQWIAENGSRLTLSLNANPVELAALITAFAGTFFVVLFGIKTDKIRSALPSAEKLDGLMYKIGGVTFAGIALLLVTGAVWANESWGRYWGWDPKEVGALVAWITYAGFLHSRITHGWKGRRTAYFALVAFLFIIFTYLGVSYLLPGLHSYA